MDRKSSQITLELIGLENYMEERDCKVSFRNFMSLSRHLSSRYFHLACHEQQTCRLLIFSLSLAVFFSSSYFLKFGVGLLLLTSVILKLDT